MARLRPLRWLRRIGIALLILLLLLVAAWALRWPLFGGLIRKQIVAALEEEGFRVEIGELSGTLVGSFEAKRLKVLDGPYLREAEVERVHASYSLLGLLRGRGDWLEEVTVEGLRAVADLDKAPPPEEPEPVEPDEPAEPFRIGSVRLERFEITVLSGEDRIVLRDGFLRGDGNGRGGYEGEFGASELTVTVDGESHRAEAARGRVRFAADVITVDPLVANGTTYPNVLRADLGGLDEDRVVAHLDFPLFGGRVKADADLDLSGDEPAGTVTAAIESLDLRPILAFLPDLPLEVGTVTGRLSATDPGGPEPVDLLARATGEFDLRISEVTYEGRSLGGVALAGELTGGEGAFRGKLDYLGTILNGSVDLEPAEPVLTAEVRVARLDLDRFKLSAEGRPIRGIVDEVFASTHGPLSDLLYDVSVQVSAPEFGEYRADGIDLSATGTPAAFHLRRLTVQNGEDTLSANARVSLEPELSFGEAEVWLEITSLPAYRNLVPVDLPPDLAGSIELSIRTEGGTIDRPNAYVMLTAERLRGEGHAVRKLEIEARAETLEDILVSLLHVEGDGPLPDVDIQNAWVTLGEAGPIVRVDSFLAAKHGLTVTNEEGSELRYGPGDEVAASLVLPPLALTEPLASLLPHLDAGGKLTRGAIRLSGTVGQPEARVELSAEGLWVVPEGLPRIDADSLTLSASYAGSNASLDDLTVAGRGWSITANGAVPMDIEDPESSLAEPLAGRLTIETLPLALLGALADVPLLAGHLNAGFTVTGTPDAPVASGSLSLGGGILGPLSPEAPTVEEISAALRVEDATPDSGRFFLDELGASALGATLSLTNGAVTRRDGHLLEPTLDVSASGIDLARVGAALAVELPVAGMVPKIDIRVRPGLEVTLDVEGRKLAYLDKKDISLDLEGVWRDGAFSTTRGVVELIEPLTGKRRSLVVKSARIPIDLGLDPPRAEPMLNAPIDLLVSADGLDLADLVPPDAEFRLSGNLGLNLIASGTLNAPRVRATASLAEGSVRAAGAPSVDELEGEFELSLAPDRLVIKKLTGLLGGGEFGVTGSVDLVDEKPTAISIGVTAEDALLLREEGLSLRSDLDLKLSGSGLDDLTLGGEVKLTSLRYTAVVDYLDSGGTSAPTLPTTKDPVLGKLKLNVTLIAPEDSIRIRNNLLDADLAGRLHIGGTVAVPRPKGRLRFLFGKLSLPTVKMTMEQAAVEFRPDQPLRPFLDARAHARVSGYEVQVVANGPGDNLALELTSNPTLTRSNIVALLTTGVVWENVSADSLRSVAANVFIHRVASEFSSGDDDSSTLSDIIGRFELSLEERTATFRVLDWLFLRASQDDPLNFGLDVLFRLTFP